jgi:hypothetical protein
MPHSLQHAMAAEARRLESLPFFFFPLSRELSFFPLAAAAVRRDKLINGRPLSGSDTRTGLPDAEGQSQKNEK